MPAGMPCFLSASPRENTLAVNAPTNWGVFTSRGNALFFWKCRFLGSRRLKILAEMLYFLNFPRSPRLRVGTSWP